MEGVKARKIPPFTSWTLIFAFGLAFLFCSSQELGSKEFVLLQLI
jgi:hypothetical protein